MFERFTDQARRVVFLAQEEARRLNHNYIGSEHILLGLIHEGEGVAAQALGSLGVPLAVARSQVVQSVGYGQLSPSGHIPFTPRAKKVLELSLRESLQLGHKYIGTEHLLLGLIREGEGVAAQVLVKLGADLNRVRQQVIQLLSGYQGKEPAGTATEGTPSTSLVLDQFGRNLTAAARELTLDPVVGRGDEVEQVLRVLSRLAGNCPLLVGPSGVGKTAIAHLLAAALVSGAAPARLGELSVTRVDPTVLSVQEVVDLLDAAAGDPAALVFLDDLHLVDDLVRSRLRQSLSAGRLRLVAATTPEGARDVVESDGVLRRYFRSIPVAETDVGTTVRMLAAWRPAYGAHHGVRITDRALEAAVLAAAGRSERRLPGAAVDLLDHVCATVSVAGSGTVDEEDVAASANSATSLWPGGPIPPIGPAGREPLLPDGHDPEVWTMS